MDNITNYLKFLFEQKIITSKNNSDAPIFNWRKRLYYDMSKMDIFKTSDMITYSVIIDDKCIGGMILFKDPLKKYTQNIKADALIQFLFVEEKYRGLKIGSNLLKDVIKKYHKIFLSTDKRSSNIAKEMYKRYGFKVIGSKGSNTYYFKKGMANE